jgi:hypothetical protein
MHQFTIKAKWDGTPIPQSEWVSLTFDARGDEYAEIRIDAPFYNDPPPQAHPGSTWLLWDYEVVELFLVSAQGSYLELEFGPHGHYLALWLTGPRVISKKHLELDYESCIEHNRWQAIARVPKTIVPSQIASWNAFSIFGPSSNRRYLSLHPLPGGAPDFHQPESFPSFPQP